jgi:hypothetical protein
MDAQVGMSGSGEAATDASSMSGDATPLPASAGTIAAAENAFMKSLLFTLSIFCFFDCRFNPTNSVAKGDEH